MTDSGGQNKKNIEIKFSRFSIDLELLELEYPSGEIHGLKNWRRTNK